MTSRLGAAAMCAVCSRASFVVRSFRPSTFVPIRSFASIDSAEGSSGSRHPLDGTFKRRDEDDAQKRRRRYVICGCMFVTFVGTQAVLLWQRRSAYRSLNKVLPAIEWTEFEEQYLSKGVVSSIVYQPQFHVGDVFLKPDANDEKAMIKGRMFSKLHIRGDKFATVPGVRFHFNGDIKSLERAIAKSLHDTEWQSEVRLTVNSFPTAWEIFAIVFLTVLATAVGISSV